ncbi:hypothetical protein GQ42DRAFT_119892, partial [Ramicandelaber brevisporus]
MSVTSQQIRQIRREIVDTVRRVVQVITSYAGNVLPEPAKRQVRSIIMSLPNQWSAVDSSSVSSSSSSASSASDSPRMYPSSSSVPLHTSIPANPIASEATARRVLAFASESSTMIDNVHGVFSDLVTGAESWI